MLEDSQRWNKYAYARNDPAAIVDRGGEAIETLWDIANIGIGVASPVSNLQGGAYGAADVDAGGLVLDTAAALTPFVPGGAGAAIKAARAVEKTADLADGVKNAARTSDRVSDATRRAFDPTDAKNVDRIKQGKPPLDRDGKPVELHHRNQDPKGSLEEMTQQQRRGRGNYKQNHPQLNRQPSRIDRNEAARQRREHWKRRAEEIERERNP